MGPLSHLWKKQCLSITTVRSFWCIAHTTAIWELEVFWRRPSWKTTELQLQPGPSRFLEAAPVGRRQSHNYNLETRGAAGVGRRQGLNCNLGTRGFGGRSSWRRQCCNCNLGTRDSGGRPCLKATGLQLQSGNSRVFWEWQGYYCNLRTRGFQLGGWLKSGCWEKMTSIEVRSLLTLPSQCAFWTHVWELVFICEQSLSVATCVFLVCCPANVCPRVLHYCLREVRWSEMEWLVSWFWASRLSVRCEMNGLFYLEVWGTKNFW